MELNLLLDTAQSRVLTDRIGLLTCGANDWSTETYSDTFMDPETGTIVVLPAPLRPEWYTNSAGINTRMAKADFTLTGASWLQRNGSDLVGDYVLDLIGANEPAISVANLDVNEGMYVGWFVYGDGRDNFTQMECGWNNATTGATGISFRMNPSGRVEIWKDGLFVGLEKFTGKGIRDKEEDISGRWVGACLIPGFRRSGVLGITSLGGVFYHNYDDLDESDPSEIVTPATKFWWYVAQGQASVQVARLRYPASGYRCSEPAFLARTPTVAQYAALVKQTFYDANGQAASTSLVQKNNVGVVYSIPDGIDCRMRVDLTSDGVRTPWVYGSQIEFPREVASTPVGLTELLDNTVSSEFTVPDAPQNVELSLHIANPMEVEAAGADRIRTIQNRAFQAKINTILFLDGVTEQPDFSPHWNPEAEHLDLTVRDLWALLEMYLYRDPKAFDGMAFKDFLADVLTDVGISAYLIEDDGYILPSMPQAGGRWNLMAERGDDAGRLIAESLKAHCGTWIYGFRPIGGVLTFMAGSPAFYGVVPQYNLYHTSAAAKIAYPVTFRDHWFSHFHEKPLPIESNYVKVTGRDIRTNRPIEVENNDYDSQDPTVAINLRQDNWVGTIRPVGVWNPSLTTLDAAQRGCEQLSERVMPANFVAEWVCEWMIKTGGDPVWRGDPVSLDEYGTYRVLSLNVDMKKTTRAAVPSDTRYRMPTRYTGLRI